MSTPKKYDHRLVVCLVLLFSTQAVMAQDDDLIPSLSMEGTEAIDPKERISGNAVVGVSFFDSGDRFDPDRVYVYFTSPVSEALKTELTTVDGRYFASFEPKQSPAAVDCWQRLDLSVEQTGSLNRRFLDRYEDQANELAMLVSDKSGRVYPVRWGTARQLDTIRIRVNAEGADAYTVKMDENGKAGLKKCAPASDKSKFKFDHNCDVSLDDIGNMKKFQIFRKRGSAYDKPILVDLVIPGSFAEIRSTAQCNYPPPRI